MRPALLSEELVTLLKSALASGSTRRALVSEPLVTLEKSAFFPSSCWTPLLGSSRRSRGSLREGLMPGSVAMGGCRGKNPTPFVKTALRWREGRGPLLARVAPRRRRRQARRGAPWIDVEPAAAGVARLDPQRLRPASRQQVAEDLFDALFMEAGVVAEGHEVAQQAGAVDARATVADADAGPVRLAGDGAVRLEQLRTQGPGDLPGRIGDQQRGIGRAVVVEVDVEPVDGFGVVIRGHRRQAEGHFHRRPDRAGEVSGDSRAHVFGGVEAGGVER